ncbi:hypothetical protein J2W24_002678 [Variovorax boronicumulans]|uniref:hypothetical protein n=1 Tax=Variovorax boronicumulans TaxID=436515 RepID=UPI00277D1CF4|nr:hypothetical protein [Variovorax boronicumulans]MDP9917027.1 hypothetical protein [Variovorax boronicumulans]
MLQRFKMKSTPPLGKKRINDWCGLRVKTTRALRNGTGEMPAGSLATVMVNGGTGLHLTFDACACCGLRLLMTRVHTSDVEVVELRATEGT